DEIEALQRGHVPLDQIAVMVRAGFQTRHFEERFIQLGIPYRVLVGARFYERQEIRDALAYLRLIAAPADDLAFESIVTGPKRGTGAAAMENVDAGARGDKISLLEAATRLLETGDLKPKLRGALRELIEALVRWRDLLKTLPHSDVAQIVLDESGYTGM